MTFTCLFLVGIWLVVFADDAVDSALAWWRRRALTRRWGGR